MSCHVMWENQSTLFWGEASDFVRSVCAVGENVEDAILDNKQQGLV